MKNCYIAGKIGDLPKKDYESLFADAETIVYHVLKMRPISPLGLSHQHDRTWKSYMVEDITAMMKCDAVFAMLNWEKSPGARIEVGLAVQLGIKVIFEKDLTA